MQFTAPDSILSRQKLDPPIKMNARFKSHHLLKNLSPFMRFERFLTENNICFMQENYTFRRQPP